jgi:hypothetical protein
MAKIFIHIGSPKTGTSTLQSILSKNHKSLLNQGVLYPKDLCNGDAQHLLACDLIEKNKKQKMPDFWYGNKNRGAAWPSLLDEMKRNSGKIDKVIISSELFFSLNGAPLEDIRNLLNGHEIKVISYLRRQDQLYSSFYNQDVKGARQWERNAYEFYNTHQLFKKSYLEVLGAWASVFGKENVIIRPFETEQLINGDIVEDFCSHVGVKALTHDNVFENDALGMNQLYVKRCLNVIGYDKSNNDNVISLLTDILPEELAKNVSYINRETYRGYRQEWLKTNRALEADYLIGESLFSKTVSLPQDLQLFMVDQDKISYFIEHVLSLLSSQKLKLYSQLFARAILYIAADQGAWKCLSVRDRALLMELA